MKKTEAAASTYSRPQQHARHRQTRIASCCLVLCLVFPLLASCASTSASGNATTVVATSTPSPGQAIIAKARVAHLLDATFTVSWTTHSTLTGYGTIPPIIGSGSGKLTMHPQRDYLKSHRTTGNTTWDTESIVDFATQTAYLKDTFAFPDDDRWHVARANGPILDQSTAALVYLQLTSPSLVGAEQLQGIAVWHVHGTLIDHGETGVIDVYVRQDTYLPVQMRMHVTAVDWVEDDTFLYPAFNTGLTIALPPASDIASD